uniref:VWFC domain-containing protein n=1 Tax=Romanomermis culicivorax TaxID=13658 RepID=A0A915KJ05_ROMCU
MKAQKLEFFGFYRPKALLSSIIDNIKVCYDHTTDWGHCRHHHHQHHHIGIENNSSLLQLSSDFTQIATACDENGDCVTCINEVCYQRIYASLLTTDNCPIVACDSVNCSGYAVWSDQCPICLCPDNVGTRNPCNSTSDCDAASSSCINNICKYPNLPAGLPAFCTVDNECPSDQACSNSTCVPGAVMKHAENI